LSPDAIAALEKTYSFDFAAALEISHKIEREQPKHPLGYLLETEALWWRIWTLAADFKYGINDARRRPKLESDQAFLDLAQNVIALAEAELTSRETAEMHFYAGMGGAQAARLYGLRGEARATAKAGVRAREHFLRALALDPDFADADLGLGLYNYYI